MHSAPSVFYPVERSRSAACALVAVWLCAVLTHVLWWFAPDAAQGGPQVAALMALPMSALLALKGWRSLRPGHLAWDGNDWHWAEAGQSPGAGCRLHACLDLQRVLLLRLRDAHGAARWIWLERSADPARWDDLRRAVCAHGADRVGAQASSDAARKTGRAADGPQVAP